MKRVYVVVEGPTEESFVKDVLARALWPHQVQLTPIVIGVPGHRGGRTNYARVKKDVVAQLKQDRGARYSTMLEFYGLGRGYPGSPVPANLPSAEKVLRIEQSMKSDICKTVPDLRSDIRFIPYIQLHEYEGLLFSDPVAFAAVLNKPHLAEQFRVIRDSVPTPEDINDDLNTAPSKRVLGVCPSYQKVIEGTLAARAVGIEAMRRECPHFRAWIENLETL